jgi:hypothetical protein
MALPSSSFGSLILVTCVLLLVLPSPVSAFGAGNIPSIAQARTSYFDVLTLATDFYSD